jgi:hypothetical protein
MCNVTISLGLCAYAAAAFPQRQSFLLLGLALRAMESFVLLNSRFVFFENSE